jgi:hypothetical protein
MSRRLVGPIATRGGGVPRQAGDFASTEGNAHQETGLSGR